jgi:copper chaperone
VGNTPGASGGYRGRSTTYRGVTMSTLIVDVEGMTCQHCVKAVTAEVEGIPGVTEVSIALQAEGTSKVTVVADEAVLEEALKAAIDEAGYSMVGVQPS